jgi:hypothetical protein
MNTKLTLVESLIGIIPDENIEERREYRDYITKKDFKTSELPILSAREYLNKRNLL